MCATPSLKDNSVFIIDDLRLELSNRRDDQDDQDDQDNQDETKTDHGCLD